MHASYRPRTPVVCGLDIGSTNIKVVALNADGVVVARVARPTPRAEDRPSIDAAALFSVLETLLIEACDTRYVVAAIAAAGVGEDGVAIDDTFTPLTPALAWFDPVRTDLLHAIAPGLPVMPDGPVDTDAARTLVGWAWARRQPGFARATGWLALTDYAAARWSGARFMSDTLAARTAAWHIGPRKWFAPRVNATLGRTDLLPPVRAAGEVLGPLRSRTLAAAGVLADDALVVVGGHDHPIAGSAIDRLDRNAVLDSMGTAEVIVGHVPNDTPAARIGFDEAPAIGRDGRTVLMVNELARNIAWAEQDDAVRRALRAIVAGEQAPDRYLESRCFIVGGAGGEAPGFRRGVPDDAVSRASAVLGALARCGRDGIETVLARKDGAGRLYAAGGWARSPGWMRIKQQITGDHIEVVPEEELTATGAALLAAHGAGWRDISVTNALYGPVDRRHS